VKYLPLPFYQLNRLRGTYSIFAKVNAVIIGAIFGFVIDIPVYMFSFWQYVEVSLNEIITWLDTVLPIAISIVSLPVDTLALFTIPTMIAIGYLAGESMGWGEWIGGLIHNDGRASERYDGRENGIEWIATRFTDLHSRNYHKLSLAIRGFYWWFLTLIPLAFVMNPIIILTAILVLAIGFPYSVVKMMEWNDAEYIYGGIQDVILIGLIGVYYLY